jgi:hypothetical protein
MAARELGYAVLEREGGTRDDLISIECSLHAVLGRLEGRGLIREPGSPKRWSVE